MGFEHLRYEVDGRGIANVSLARPPANAVNLELMAELREVATRITLDGDVRVALLRSDVDRFFAAGADLSMINAGWDRIGETATTFHAVGNAWEAIPQPTIAVLDGVVAGAGCEMALTCDLRLSSERTRIGLPEVKVGLIPAGGGTQRLPRLIGRAAAMPLLLRGTLIDAEEAHRVGLVTELHPSGQLDGRADDLAAELAALPPLTLREIKRCGRTANEVPLDVGLANERDAIERLGRTQDAPEGVAAFVEDRAPVYVGR